MKASTVLLVDDDEVLGQVLRRVLTRQGCQVIQAGTVAQALQLAREHEPRVGLLDLCLPDGDGVTLAEQLTAEMGAMPLILMTAYPLRLRDHPELARQFRRVLTKPLNLEELRQTIDAALAESGNGRSEVQPAVEGAAPPAPSRDLETRAAHAAPQCSVETGSEAAPPHAIPTASPPTSQEVEEGEPSRSAVAEAPPRRLAVRRRRRLLPILIGLVVVATGLGLVLPSLGVTVLPNYLHQATSRSEPPAVDTPPPIRPVVGKDGVVRPDLFEVDPAVLRTLKVQTPALDGKGMVQQALPRKLEMSGSLAFDPNTLGRIQSRFGGEVVELGRNDQGGLEPLGARSDRSRPLKVGDTVVKSQLMAVVWSKDLGEKKSELVDALSQLALDQETLAKLEALYREGNTSEAIVRQARRNVSAGLNSANRIERTLRIWKVPEAEVEAIKAEARHVIGRKGERDLEKEKNWARVEVRAPFDGVVVEKNVALGNIVDTTFDLYKIANVEELAVYVNAYEEDLRLLQEEQRLRAYSHGQLIPWTVFLTSDPQRTPLATNGIERIGLVVDPNQHTNFVMGRVYNPADRNDPAGRLRAGQFVTAVVELSPPPDVVSVPTAAVVEDGRESVLFVQPDPARPVFSRKRVAVTARFQDMVYVRSQLTEGQRKGGLSPVLPGDRVVTEGAIMIKAGLEEALATNNHHENHSAE